MANGEKLSLKQNLGSRLNDYFDDYDNLTRTQQLERVGEQILNRTLGDNKGTQLSIDSRAFQDMLWETVDTFQEDPVYNEYGDMVSGGVLYNDSEIDAIRHYYGTKFIAEEYGIPAAAFASTGHEVSFLFKENTLAETGADLYNNIFALYDSGMGIGHKGTDFFNLIDSNDLFDRKDEFIEMADYALTKTKQAGKD